MRPRVRNILVKDKTEEQEAEDECRHYWIIEVAKGSTSIGVCKLCGVRKQFLNSISGQSNMVRRHANPFELPEMLGVEFDEEQGKQ